MSGGQQNAERHSAARERAELEGGERGRGSGNKVPTAHGSRGQVNSR